MATETLYADGALTITSDEVVIGLNSNSLSIGSIGTVSSKFRTQNLVIILVLLAVIGFRIIANLGFDLFDCILFGIGLPCGLAALFFSRRVVASTTGGEVILKNSATPKVAQAIIKAFSTARARQS